MAQSNGLNPTYQGIVTSGSGQVASAAGTQVAVLGSIGIYTSTGAPTVSAPKGSLCFNTSAVTGATRLYINTTGSTVWAAFTAAA